MKNWLQKKFVHFLVAHLFNSIAESDTLTNKNGIVMFKGKPLSKEVIQKLSQDAQVFHESMLWQIISNECRYQANLRMFEQSMNVDDILAGKMMLHNLEIIENKLNSLK